MQSPFDDAIIIHDNHEITTIVKDASKAEFEFFAIENPLFHHTANASLGLGKDQVTYELYCFISQWGYQNTLEAFTEEGYVLSRHRPPLDSLPSEDVEAALKDCLFETFSEELKGQKYPAQIHLGERTILMNPENKTIRDLALKEEKAQQQGHERSAIKC